MKTDGIFTTHSYRIETKQAQPVRLVIFGDVHWDSPNHAKKAWQEDLKHFKSLKDAYFLGMGDYLDSTSTSERDCLGRMSSEMHETLARDINALQAAKVERLAAEMAFMRGRLVGLLGGNHYWKFGHGGTTDTELARMLGTKYLGCSSFIRLTLDVCGRCSTIDIWAHHGAGGARLPGGSLNRVDQMREHAEADVFVMGHDHKRGVIPATPRLYLQSSSRGGLNVRHRQQWLVRSGSYLASYEPGISNYNVDAARGPSSLGHIELLFKYNKNEDHEPAEVKITAIS
jgi:hypothetical protein